MKGNMLIIAPLCLLLFWMMPSGSKKINYFFSQREAVQNIPLSMMDKAVDDMYSHCKERMTKKVKGTYFKNEKNKGIFKDVWKKAESCTNRNMKNRNKGDEALTADHMHAICVYTSDNQKFYETFNNEVRTGRKIYGKSFQYHSLHFWLTSAIQILNNNKNCHVTYRRTQHAFTVNDGQLIRFGFFASSSLKADLKRFGNKSCFKIKTCSGAYLKKYPYLQDKEEEVLIPPYEMFNITRKKEKKFVENLSDCKVVYFLQSVGVDSNLDCHAAN